MQAIKKDIQDRKDIHLLVDSFYNKVNNDTLLSPVFNEKAGVSWEKHLPIMYDFWSTMLLGDKSYRGNPFMKHIPLPINKVHFEKWLSLFLATVDEHFTGETAEEAKTRARNIAGVFQYKLEHIHAGNPQF
ncbi:group III truncated hemoglobin [Rhodocytophaga aerolata]|uniref:Group III truncated hemoglobin n=1 Tax=Rhodocytophaga aerolata TaxID=455078 RepID=A0ABT8R8B2_9BACT|nr:group III truncated hemoglobin [Rhodocytophaga aerolata]MDO1448204.1 group III truncated hemoglobin [Rhodocytophaga aerolata]